jgi:hypothetical protein
MARLHSKFACAAKSGKGLSYDNLFRTEKRVSVFARTLLASPPFDLCAAILNRF